MYLGVQSHDAYNILSCAHHNRTLFTMIMIIQFLDINLGVKSVNNEHSKLYKCCDVNDNVALTALSDQLVIAVCKCM